MWRKARMWKYDALHVSDTNFVIANRRKLFNSFLLLLFYYIWQNQSYIITDLCFRNYFRTYMADPDKISPHMNILSVKYPIFKAICEYLDIDSKYRDLICSAENTFYQLKWVLKSYCNSFFMVKIMIIQFFFLWSRWVLFLTSQRVVGIIA